MRQFYFFMSTMIVFLVFINPAVFADDISGTGDGYDPDLYHLGEDGVLYPKFEDRSSWLMGKVEPAVASEYEVLSELNVIVFLEGSDLTSQTDSIRDTATAAIKPLAARLKEIDDKYKPAGPLDEQAEKLAVQAAEFMMTFEDQLERMELRQMIDAKLDRMRKDVGQVHISTASETLDEVVAFIENNGGVVKNTSSTVITVSAVIPWDFLTELASHPKVVSIAKNRQTQYELDVSMDSCGFDSWWNNSIDGGAYDFGIVDSGVQEDHPAFSGVNAFYTNSGTDEDPSDSGHGTHVAGIAISGNSTYRGGAYGVDKVIWSFSSSDQGNVIDRMDWQVRSATEQPEVINHSLGYGIADDTDYSDSDSFYDALVYTYSMQVSKSAGNEGWNDDNPRITHPGPAYNIFVVANMDDRNTLTRDDDQRAWDSSVGPTLNGRRKPDICAPGISIMSTNNSWSGTGSGNTDPSCWDTRTQRSGYDWSRCSGTSMSAPHVSGAVILMEDGGNHNPLAQKAVLINTADAWTSNETSTTSDDEEVDGTHWDKSYGWGYLDMSEAYYNRGDYFTGSVVARNDTPANDDYKLYKGIMYNGEKATLTWYKRSNYVNGEPPSTKYALSDLNLRLYDENDGSLEDSDLDGDDNVHQVAAGSTTYAIIKVYSWSSSFSGASSESFALATEENFVEVGPPTFSNNYSRPNYVGPYQTFDVTVRVFNNGDFELHNGTVTLNPITGVTISGGGARAVGSIDDGDNSETVYTLTTSGLTAGTKWLSINFTSDCYQETYTHSSSYGLSLIVETTAPTSDCTSGLYDNSSPINVNWTASDSQTGVKNTYLYVKTPGSSSFSYAYLYQPGTSGTFNYTPSAGDGTYQFAVRSVDNGGNWEDIPTTAQCSVIYDTVDPSTSVSTPTYDGGGSIALSYSGSDPSPSSGLEFIDFWYKKGSGGTWTYTGQAAYLWSGTVYFTPSDGDGLYYFASRAKDNAQNIENYNYSVGDDTTIYDTTSPISSATSPAATNSSPISVGWTASDAASGVQRTYLYVKYGAGGTWTYTGLSQTGTAGTFNYSPSSGNGTYYFASRARDNTNHYEPLPAGSGDTNTKYDTVSPTGGIIIEGGDAATTSLLVDLTLNATDGLSGVSHMCFSNNGVDWSPWQSYSTSKSNWSLTSYGGNSTPGMKVVFVKYRDNASNESGAYSDSIEYVLDCSAGDADGDNDVDLNDVKTVADMWLMGGCIGPDWCGGADLNMDGGVDFADMARVAEFWRCGL